MTKLIVISILFLSSIAFSGEIYTWTDENGVKHFSNTAPPKSAQVMGKETNYVAPPEPPKPKLTADDRAKIKEKETQLQIEREKTMQKSIDLKAEQEKTLQVTHESVSRSIESTGKTIRSILGRP